MPEYLAPGVYIEEIPARLKAIEGVSTSTAGMVGAAERGPVPGLPAPFDGIAQNFVVPRDPTPVLVTSFAEFTRQFGGVLPLPDPDHNGYLARAVKGFFDNGGKRCFVARVVDVINPVTLATTATQSQIQLAQGSVLRLARRGRIGDRTVALTSLRRVGDGRVIQFFNRSNDSLILTDRIEPFVGPPALPAFNTTSGEVALANTLPADLNPNDVYALADAALMLDPTVAAPAIGDVNVTLTSLRGITNGAAIGFLNRATNVAVDPPNTVSSFVAATRVVTLSNPLGAALNPAGVYAIVPSLLPGADGPVFHARNPGAWSARLTVLISNADRGPVPVAGPSAVNQIPVQSTSSFYRGAIVEITDGVQRGYGEVRDILPGNRLLLAGAVPFPVLLNPAHFVRVIEIDVTIADESGAEPVVETFRALTWNQRNEADVRRRHYATVINTSSRLAYAQPPGVGTPPLAGSESADLDSQPTNSNGFPTAVTTPGGDGNPPDDDDYIGADNGPGARTGIEALQDVEDIRIIAAPGRFADTVHNALISQCERLRYRFAVLDADIGSTSVNQILADRNLYDTSFAALYVPWIEVTENGQRLQLPPSGHVAGIYARSDVERGVGKAPANEVVRGIVGLQTYITTGEQEVLNPRGVNCIRRFEGRGLRVWGARTLSSDPEVRYLNVRRELIFIEASLDRGTQYVVFEPNIPSTWSRVVDSVSAFLNTQWRNGLLFGRRPEDAFFVRCDESTMSADDIQNGRLIVQIGVSIVRPAEFVIFRIQQITGFANQP